ncbi:class I SAM-dependent methyltransferase [Candidatus Bathyarchaeota archaeon]|nr:class I SAM-dependent methyltransferase [Candidatus Bathyarchaeota archaeon]
MSGAIVNKFWHFGSYKYLFYRFVIEEECNQQFLMQRTPLLDVGCGPWISSLSLVPFSIRVIGIDIDSSNILSSHRKAKQEGFENFEYIIASAAYLPIRNEGIGVAVCVDVLEHIINKKDVVQEVSRTLARQSRFVGSTTNLSNPVMMFDSLAPITVTRKIEESFTGSQYSRFYKRHSRLSYKALLRILAECGFELLEVRLLEFPPFAPWKFEFSRRASTTFPIYIYLWMVFDRVTNFGPLRYLKNTMTFCAVRGPD